MKMELNLPDNLPPPLVNHIGQLLDRIQDDPSFAEDIWLHDDAPDNFVMTPEIRTKIEEGLADIAVGRILTSEQVDKNLAEYRAQWLAQNN